MAATPENQPDTTSDFGDGFYIERNSDHELLRHIEAGHDCYICGAPQSGKTRLLEVTKNRFKDIQGYKCILVSLTDLKSVVDPHSWYLQLSQNISKDFCLSLDTQRKNDYDKLYEDFFTLANRNSFEANPYRSPRLILPYFFTRVIAETVKAEKILVLIDSIEEIDKFQDSQQDLPLEDFCADFFRATITDCRAKIQEEIKDFSGSIQFIFAGLTYHPDIKVEFRKKITGRSLQIIELKNYDFNHNCYLESFSAWINHQGKHRLSAKELGEIFRDYNGHPCLLIKAIELLHNDDHELQHKGTEQCLIESSQDYSRKVQEYLGKPENSEACEIYKSILSDQTVPYDLNSRAQQLIIYLGIAKQVNEHIEVYNSFIKAIAKTWEIFEIPDTIQTPENNLSNVSQQQRRQQATEADNATSQLTKSPEEVDSPNLLVEEGHKGQNPVQKNLITQSQLSKISAEVWLVIGSLLVPPFGGVISAVLFDYVLGWRLYVGFFGLASLAIASYFFKNPNHFQETKQWFEETWEQNISKVKGLLRKSKDLFNRLGFVKKWILWGLLGLALVIVFFLPSRLENSFSFDATSILRNFKPSEADSGQIEALQDILEVSHKADRFHDHKSVIPWEKKSQQNESALALQYIYDNINEESRLEVEKAESFWAIDVSKGGRIAAVTTGKDKEQNSITIWNNISEEGLFLDNLHSDVIDDLKISDNNSLLLTSSKGEIKIWDLTSNNSDQIRLPKQVLSWGHGYPSINNVEITEDGKTVVALSNDGRLKAWRFQSGLSGNMTQKPIFENNWIIQAPGIKKMTINNSLSVGKNCITASSYLDDPSSRLKIWNLDSLLNDKDFDSLNTVQPNYVEMISKVSRVSYINNFRPTNIEISKDDKILAVAGEAKFNKNTAHGVLLVGLDNYCIPQFEDSIFVHTDKEQVHRIADVSWNQSNNQIYVIHENGSFSIYDILYNSETGKIDGTAIGDPILYKSSNVRNVSNKHKIVPYLEDTFITLTATKGIGYIQYWNINKNENYLSMKELPFKTQDIENIIADSTTSESDQNLYMVLKSDGEAMTLNTQLFPTGQYPWEITSIQLAPINKASSSNSSEQLQGDSPGEVNRYVAIASKPDEQILIYKSLSKIQNSYGLINRIPITERIISEMVFDPTGNGRLFFADQNSIQLIEDFLKKDSQVLRVEVPNGLSGKAKNLSVSPDGQLVAYVGEDKKLYLKGISTATDKEYELFNQQIFSREAKFYVDQKCQKKCPLVLFSVSEDSKSVDVLKISIKERKEKKSIAVNKIDQLKFDRNSIRDLIEDKSLDLDNFILTSWALDISGRYLGVGSENMILIFDISNYSTNNRRLGISKALVGIYRAKPNDSWGVIKHLIFTPPNTDNTINLFALTDKNKSISVEKIGKAQNLRELSCKWLEPYHKHSKTPRSKSTAKLCSSILAQ